LSTNCIELNGLLFASVRREYSKFVENVYSILMFTWWWAHYLTPYAST